MNEFTVLQLRNKKIFEQNQIFLLQFINSFYGRSFLGINDSRIITKIFPNGWSFINPNGTFEGIFFTYEKVAKFLLPIIEKIDIAKEHYPALKNDLLDAAIHFIGSRR